MSDERYLFAWGYVVSKRRRELGLKQAQVAQALEVAQSYVSGIEHGTRSPSVGDLPHLADVLGYSSSSSLVVDVDATHVELCKLSKDTFRRLREAGFQAFEGYTMAQEGGHDEM